MINLSDVLANEPARAAQIAQAVDGCGYKDLDGLIKACGGKDKKENAYDLVAKSIFEATTLDDMQRCSELFTSESEALQYAESDMFRTTY